MLDLFRNVLSKFLKVQRIVKYSSPYDVSCLQRDNQKCDLELMVGNETQGVEKRYLERSFADDRDYFEQTCEQYERKISIQRSCSATCKSC